MKKLLLLLIVGISIPFLSQSQITIADDSTAIIKNSSLGDLVFANSLTYTGNKGDLEYSFLKGDTINFGISDSLVTGSGWTPVNSDFFIYVENNPNFTYNAPNNKFKFWLKVENPTNSDIDSAEFVVTILPAEAPSIVSKNLSLPENATAASTFAAETNFNTVFSASDPDGDNALIDYTKKSGDSQIIVVDQNDGTFKIRANTSLNYESKSSYTIRVLATDQDGDTASAPFVVDVNNVNESPSISLKSGYSITRNWLETTNTGNVFEFQASDPEINVTDHVLTYSITSQTGTVGNNSAFQINSITGVVTVVNVGNLDYESGVRTVTLIVRVQDSGPFVTANGGSKSASMTVTISITNDPNESYVVRAKTAYQADVSSNLTIDNLCNNLNIVLDQNYMVNPPGPYLNYGPYSTLSGQDIYYQIGRIQRTKNTATWGNEKTLPKTEVAYQWNTGARVYSKVDLSYIDQTAFPGKEYAYRVRLAQGNTIKTMGNISSYWYGDNFPGYPSKPLNVLASEGNATNPCDKIDITWSNQAENNNFTGIHIYYQEKISPGQYKDEVLLTNSLAKNASSHSWTVPSSLKGSSIRFNVYAFNGNSATCPLSDPGVSNDGFTAGNSTPPQNLSSEPEDECSRVELLWDDINGETTADVFYIYKKVGNATATVIDSVPIAVSTYDDFNPDLGNNVTYFIKGKNSCGVGASSNNATNSLEPLAPKVTTYTSQTLDLGSENVLKFDFTPGDNSLKHKLLRDGIEIKEIPAGISTVNDDNAEACRFYEYTIGGVNGCGIGYQDTIIDRIVPDLNLGEINATDGDYLDKIEISWSDIKYESGYKVFKGNQLLTLTAENVSLFVDQNSLPGAINTYKIEAINSCNSSNIQSDIGFADPNGEISGHVSTANGEYVSGVEVNVTPIVGKSVKFNGTPIGQGKAISFPNSATSVEVGSNGAPISITDGITIEGWFNFKSLGSGTFLSLNNASASSIDLVNPTAGQLQVVISSCSNASCNTTCSSNNTFLTLNSWTHIAATIEPNGATKIYKNGILVAQNSNMGVPFGPISSIKLGSDLSNNSTFYGEMDEIRIWEDARQGNEVYEIFDQEIIGSSYPSLKRYFRCNQTGSDNTKLKNTSSAPIAPGEVSLPAAVLFVAPSPVSPVEGGGYLNVGNINQSYFDNGSFAVSVWIKGVGGDIKNASVISGQGLNAEFTVGKGGAPNVANFKTTSSVRLSGSTALNDGQWHNIIYNYDKALQQMMILVDGQLDAVGNVGSISFTNWDFAIGAEKNGKFPFKGYLDDVSLWNGTLDTNYISKYYNRGWGGDEENLIAYWKLDEGSAQFGFDRSDNDLHAILIDQGTVPPLVEWSSSERASVKNLGITDSLGNYFIQAINYGSDVNGTNFTITPSKLENGIAHQFNPQNVTRNLSYTSVRHDGVDFTDISTVPISGYVKYHNTTCFVEFLEARRNGISANPVSQTNKKGVWILDSPLGIQKIEIFDPWVKPDSMILFADKPISNLKFESFESYSVSGKVSGNCGVVVGAAYIEFENDDQCFKKTILTANNGSYFMDSIPPFSNLKMHVKPINQLITFDPIYIYHDKDTVIDFQYREDLQAEISFDTSLVKTNACGDDIEIISQGKNGAANITIYEEYPGGNRCYIDTATFRIQDEISSPPVIYDTSFSKNPSGTLLYLFKAGEANLGGVGATQYRKKLEVSVTDSSARQVVVNNHILVEGARKRASTFVTTSPDVIFTVLRDPPGDASYSFLAKDSTYCNAVSVEGSVSAGLDLSFEIGGGVNATAGWIAEVNFDVEVTAGFGLTLEGEFRYSEADEWCFTLDEEIATDDDELYVGENMDLFMGGALNYTFAKIDFLNYDMDNCKVDLTTGVGRNPEGIATLFNYTQLHIEGDLIPNLEFLRDVPGTPADTVAFWQKHIDGWNATLEDNRGLKIAAQSDKTINSAQYEKYDINYGGVDLGNSDNLDKIAGSGAKYSNVSFSYGTNYDNTQSYSYDNEQSYGGTFTIGGSAEKGVELDVAGIVQIEFGMSVWASTSIGRDNTTTKGVSRTIGYHLGDNDPGDYFSVNIKRDLTYKTPVFETVAGESMCPHEDNTVAREKVQLTAEQNTIVNIPSDEPAVYKLALTNLSEAEDGQRYGLAFWDGYQDGATVLINGQPLAGDNGYMVYNVPGELANNTVPLTIEVHRAPKTYQHTNIVMAAFSDCEWGLMSSGGSIDAISTTSLNAYWQKPCSEVSMLNPNTNSSFVVDQSSNDQLTVSFTDYDTAATSPVQKFVLQFAPENGAWAKADEVNFSDLLYTGQFGETPEFASLTWNVPTTMIDGKYKVRVKAECPSTESVTDPVEGVVSRDAPTVFGKPEPEDGVLDAGDNIAINFNENIDCSKLNVESIALKGVLSGFDYNSVNHGIAFTGGSYGSIPQLPSHNYGSSKDFTIELWVKTTAQAGDPIIVADKDWSNGRNKGWAISCYQNTRWRFNIGDGADMVNVTGGVIGDNQWHHIAVGVDRDYGPILYQDGLIVGVDTSGAILTIDNIDNTLPVTIAQDGTGNYNYSFSGTIDELRIWDIFKFQLNILQGRFRSYGFDEPNLNGIYRFDNEGSATTFFDRSRHANFGTFNQINNGALPTFDNNNKAPISMENVESLVNITWTCAGNRIVIEPITPIKYLENSFFTATVFDAKDLYGNAMIQPYSWKFYVDQNYINWENRNVTYSVKEGDNLEFVENLVNGGPNLEPYTLTDIPTWMEVNPTSGTVASAYKEPITFKVDSFVNPGVYNQQIVANTDNGFEKIDVTVNVLCPDPDWYVDPTSYQYSMSVTTQLIVEGDTSKDVNDKIAAFVGDEVRGVASVQKISNYKYLAFVTVYSDTALGENINFKIWDASDCKEYPVTIPNLGFYNDSIFGSIDTPIFVRTTGMVAQTIDFSKGWNWFSLYVNPDSLFGNIPINAALSGLTPSATDVIRSQSSTSQYYPIQGLWAGSLSNLNNRAMYNINLANQDQLYLAGHPVNALNTPITINQGWNYVGYPVQGNLAINTALGSLSGSLQTGDVIKSQYGYAEFVKGSGWFGSLKFLEPGLGYMLKSSGPGTLIYPATASTRNREIQNNENLKFDNEFRTAINELDWKVNPESFDNVLSISGQLMDVKENQISGDRIIVAAFVGDECRGLTQAREYQGKWMYYLSLYSNAPADEEVTFKAYFENQRLVKPILEKVKFDGISKIGETSHPFYWHFEVKNNEEIAENLTDFDGNFLSQNQPNPMVNNTSFTFGIVEDAEVTIEVHNVAGQLIKTLISGNYEAGEYTVKWNGADNSGRPVKQGVYYYTLKAGNFVDSKKLIIVNLED